MYIYREGVYRISVRNLVEFVLRSGDIDNRIGTDINKEEAMVMGTKIHRRIQKSMGASYTAEVMLRVMKQFKDVIICVEGRADGIIDEAGEIVIDEIKGVYDNPQDFEDARSLHKAQAMCYGYMYMQENDIDHIGIQVTYCDMDTLLIRRFKYMYTRVEIESWFAKLFEGFAKWIVMHNSHRNVRNESIHRMAFPYVYREGQRNLVVSAYKAISMKRNLFIEAPTGTGKTLSTVFPAVMSMGEGLSDKIFYLTAKTVTRAVADDTYTLLRERGLVFKSIILTAKEKICFLDEMNCNPEACPYAKGHYDRVNEACFDIVTHEHHIDRDTIVSYAMKHKVCPFELGLDISYWVDGIICDYNYVFDPNVYLKRFFADGAKGEYVFLVDEAHNLVERARSMYSATLVKEDILDIKRLVGDRDAYFCKLLDKVNKEFLELKRETESYRTFDSIGKLTLAIMAAYGHIEKYKDNFKKMDISEEMTQIYFKFRHFLNMAELIDENYLIYAEHLENGNFCVKEFCVNPSLNLSERLNHGNSAIFFSATLLPMPYYKELLGDKDDFAIYAHSVFDTKKRRIYIASDVSSKYTRRNASEYNRIASYIEAVASKKKGNYFVFLPSYRYMEDVLQIFKELYGEQYEIVSQSNNMSDEMREEFIAQFTRECDKSRIGFVVLGGVFSEGIDMRGDMLIGNIIVGTGLPQVCTERELLRQFYDDKDNMGYEYAYVYPGMNKVMQAAGRLIRTEEDTGVIALLDERFLQNQYRSIFPREWEDAITVKSGNIGSHVEEFWVSVN